MAKNPVIVSLSSDNQLARLLAEALAQPVAEADGKAGYAIGVWDGSALLTSNTIGHLLILGNFPVPAAWSVAAHTLLQRPVRLNSLCSEIESLLSELSDEAVLMKGVTFSLSGRYVETGTGRINLPQKEAELLAALYAVKGAPISRDALLEKVWGYVDSMVSHTLETHLYKLRQKLRPLDPYVSIKVENGHFALVCSA